VTGFLIPLAQSNGSGSGSLLIFLVLMFVLFYFLLIRPQQKRQRAMRQLMESLEVGDQILTVGGMFGTVQEIDDDGVTVEVAPGIDVRFVRTAIARRLDAEDEVALDEEEELADDEEEFADEGTELPDGGKGEREADEKR
jgi:preprotein translocase subunit YajC